MRKKAIAWLMTVILLVGEVPAAFAKSDKITQGTALNFLAAIGCINEELAAEPDETVTRGEFADMVLSLINMRDLATYDKPIFMDVTLGTQYAAQINTAFSLGIISRDSTKRFYPSEPLTMNAAAEILVRLLGYANVANNSDGEWYLTYASQLGLFDGVTAAENSVLTVRGAAVMVYNALNAQMIEQTGDNKFEKSNAAMMEAVLHIYCRTGTVTAAGNMNLEDGGYLREGTIKIDGIEYSLEETGFSAVLGQSVRFWYSLDDNDERILCYIENTNEDISSLFIDAEDLEKENSKFSADTVVYDTGGGKTKTVKLDTDKAVVNGIVKQLTMNDFDFTGFDGGYVKLSRNDKNEYNYVEIVKYNNHVVSGVNKSSMTLWFEDNTGLSLDKDDYAGSVSINLTDMYYTEKTIDDIRIGDVLSVYKSASGNFVGAFVSSVSFNGTVQLLSNEEKEIKIDGKIYSATCDLNCTVNREYAFSMDFRNKIAKIDTVSASASYVYLISAYQDETEDTYFKMFDPSADAVNNFKAASKIRVGGVSYNKTDFSRISEALANTSDQNSDSRHVSQLVQISKNSTGEIVVIDVAENGSNDSRFSLDYSMESAYSASFGFIQGRFSTTDNSTLIIRVPKDRTDYEKYTAEAGMPVSCNVNTYVYDIDTRTNIPAAIVVDMGTIVYTDDLLDYSPYALVADVREEAVGGDIKLAVTYFILNKEEKVYYDSDDYLTDKANNDIIAVAGLTKGDILQAAQSSAGFAAVRMIYKSPARGKDHGFMQGTHIGSVNGKFVSYGTVRSLYGQYIIVRNPDSGLELTLNIGGARIYRYDVSHNEAEIVSRAELEYGQNIVFRSVDAQMGDIVIIKED